MASTDLTGIITRCDNMTDMLGALANRIFAANGYRGTELYIELNEMAGKLYGIIRELKSIQSNLTIGQVNLSDNSLDPELRTRLQRQQDEAERQAKNWTRRAEKALTEAQALLDRGKDWKPETQQPAMPDVPKPSTPTSTQPKAPAPLPTPKPKPTPAVFPKTDAHIIDGVYTGTVTPRNLPLSYYNRTRDDMMDAVKKGMGDRKGFEALMEDLDYNVQAFSAAKTYNLVRDLDNAKRSTTSQAEYEAKAQALVKQYDTWGEAEVNTAQQQTHQAKQWQIITDDRDLFPTLRYSTIGDACKICRPLDGITAPVNSPVWRRIYPCNHYNCYCIVIQLTAGEDLTNKAHMDALVEQSAKLMNPVFLSNPGITKQIYTNKHPYFSSVPKDDRKFAKENFGLPIK